MHQKQPMKKAVVGELEVNQEVDDDEWNIGDGFGNVIDEKRGAKLNWWRQRKTRRCTTWRS